MGSHARRPSMSTGRPGLAADWSSQPIALRVLRAFLGVTFVYAGIQKFADPNFLHAGSPDYIGNQLQVFANGSPIGPLLRFLGHVPVLTGVGIALAEIAIGLGTLLGVARFSAAVGGLVVSLMLFLSATWHVHPYFLGSDSMYAVGWIAYLAGMWEAERRRRGIGAGPGYRASARTADESRRRMLRGAMVAGAAVLFAGVGRALMGSPSQAASGFSPPAGRAGDHHGGSQGGTGHGTPTKGPTPHHTKHGQQGPSDPPTSGPGTSGPGTSGPGTSGPGASGPSSGGPPPAQGRVIASLDSVPVGGAVPFTGPGGQPCALFRFAKNDVAAYSRICTHAGCLVGYDSGSKLLVCPCHGAEFDPAQGAQPVAGPAPTPLEPVHVVVDRSRGEVVLPS